MRLFAILLAVATLAGCTSDHPPISDADQLLVNANRHLAAGEDEEALEDLNASIDAEPSIWSLFTRAKLHEKLGNDNEARADCEAALQIDPEYADALWLQAELAKPKPQRFQGRFKTPPSANR